MVIHALLFKIFLIWILSILCLVKTGEAGSPNNKRFEVDEIDKVQQMDICGNMQLTYFQEESNIDMTIENFDVSEDGKVAIALTNHHIVVFDSNSKFLYGFSFNDPGTCYVTWQEENVAIVTVRGSLLITIDYNGNLVSISKIVDSPNNTEHGKYIIQTIKEVGGIRYEIKNNLGIFNILTNTYSQLVKTDTNGNIAILINARKTQMVRILITIVFAVIIISTVMIIFIVEIKKYNRKKS